MKNGIFGQVFDWLLKTNREAEKNGEPWIVSWNITKSEKSVKLHYSDDSIKYVRVKDISSDIYMRLLSIPGPAPKGRVIKVKRQLQDLAYYSIGDGFTEDEQYDARRLVREMAEQLNIGAVHIEPFYHSLVDTHINKV